MTSVSAWQHWPQARVDELRGLLHECVASGPGEQADRIREAAMILPELSGATAKIDHARIETMLACGAFESAVLLMVGDTNPLMLSRGCDGTCLATRLHPDGTDEVMSEASTLALALLSAHVSILLAGLREDMPEITDFTMRHPGRLH